jgi:hypothetical protein
MKFFSIWRHPVYIVRRTIKEQVAPGQIRTIPGLKAEFHEGGWPEGGQLDTEDEQRRLNWSDDDRKAVEKHLLAHSDFGHGIFLPPEPDTEPETVPDVRGCSFVEITDDGANRCGKRREKASEYCPRHHELVFPPTDAGKERPKKAARSAKAKVKAEA